MLKPTLLIVDDEKPTREGLRAALEERYDVYLAEDAKTAMELLAPATGTLQINIEPEVVIDRGQLVANIV